MDLSGMSASELAQLERHLKYAKVAAKQQSAVEVKKILDAQAVVHGFRSINDVIGNLPVVMKYADPNSDNKWSGQGRKPEWVSNHLSNGGKLEDLLIS